MLGSGEGVGEEEVVTSSIEDDSGGGNSETCSLEVSGFSEIFSCVGEDN